MGTEGKAKAAEKKNWAGPKKKCRKERSGRTDTHTHTDAREHARRPRTATHGPGGRRVEREIEEGQPALGLLGGIVSLWAGAMVGVVLARGMHDRAGFVSTLVVALVTAHAWGVVWSGTWVSWRLGVISSTSARPFHISLSMLLVPTQASWRVGRRPDGG